jgi:SAM-dependent methyltransferase
VERPLSFLKYTIERIGETNPVLARKMTVELSNRDSGCLRAAEDFLGRFERYAIAIGISFDYGIECFQRMQASMLQERASFLRTGQYSNVSFAEVEQRVYSDPKIMEYHMYGLVFAQFLWSDQFERFRFFRENLPARRPYISSYLEIGGGHALYVSEAVRLLAPTTTFDMVDVSATSLRLARGMSQQERIQYHLMDFFDFPGGRTFEFITIGEVIEHVERPLKMLQKVRGLLSKDGRAYVTTPANAPMIDHIHLFHDAAEIRDLIREAGFEIESERTCYAENVSPERAEKLKLPLMFAAFVKPAQAQCGCPSPPNSQGLGVRD